MGALSNLVPRVFRLFGQQGNARKTLGTSKKFLIGCSVTVSIVLPQKSCGNKIRCPQSLPGVAPLTKKPEDCGYEIGHCPTRRLGRTMRENTPLMPGEMTLKELTDALVIYFYPD